MQSFLRKLYAFKFCNDFVLIAPITTVMFIDYGITPWQMSVIFLAWSITTFLCEIPSGVLGDLYSRKKIMYIAQVFRFIGYSTWLIFPNFWGFLFSFIVWAIKSAFTSGSYQAYVYDYLKEHGQEDLYAKAIGRGRSYAFLGLISASVVLSWIVLLGYPAVIWGSLVFVVLSIFFLSRLPEDRVGDFHEKSPLSYMQTLMSGFQFLKKEKRMLSAIIFLAVIAALPTVIEDFWPIVGREKFWPEQHLGILVACMYLAGAIGSRYAYRFKSLFEGRWNFVFAVTGGCLFLGSVLSSLWFFFFLFMTAVLAAMLPVLVEEKIQSQLASETRATLSSVSEFFSSILYTLLYVLIGWAADLIDYSFAFLVIGVMIVVIAFGYMLVGKIMD